MNENHAVSVSNLSKRFGEIQAVNNISFSVAAGEIFSLLGPNGAGKSTTISILSGLFYPDSGDAHILGYSILKQGLSARASLGVVPQDIALYPDLSARENLLFWGRMYGLRGERLTRRVNEVLDLIGINGRQNSKIATFSGGMKRRVNIGAALLHEPRVVILDEPTVGIDPQSRRHILDGIKELNRQGVTVIYTTHYMEEAEELSHHIAIMDHGQIIARGTHSELTRLVGGQARVDLTLNQEAGALVEACKNIPEISQASIKENLLTVMTADSNKTLPHLFESANALSLRISSVNIQEPNLEAVFLHLTGRELRD